MRKTLSHFGWITITVIVLTVLIAAATPAGQNIMEKMFDFSDKLTQDGIDGGLVNSDALYDISIVNAPDGLLTLNKTSACPGEVITITLTNTEDYYCDGFRLSYNGRENTITSFSFKMPDNNVLISPIWGEFPYTKIYFNNSMAASNMAGNVNDNQFNSRLPVNVDGNTYYVVHDYSDILGYNNNLNNTNKYAGNASVIKVITGASCKKISTSAFANCPNLEEVFISKSVNAIERAAFMNCRKLKSLSINEGLKEIQDSAFSHCVLLGYDGGDGEDINVSDSVLEFPTTLQIIGGSSFAYTAYEKITIPANVHTVGNYAFYKTDIVDGNLFYGDNISNIYPNSFTIN